MGPTASGKSDLAIALTKQYPFEIISVDSAMIYRGMNIGTAKPDAKLLVEIKHHLIDIRDPIEHYSAGQFCADANACMEEIWQAGKWPLLVGGTMLYYRALQQGLADMPPIDAAVRKTLLQELDAQGLAKLYAELQSCDPIAAEKIRPQDTQRILRALEVFRSTQMPLSSYWQTQTPQTSHIQWCNIALWPNEREVLHARIAERFNKMIELGFIEEVKGLQQKFPSLTIDTPSMRSVGYRQVWQFLMGEINSEELLAKGAAATRQLAKRQLTWLRTWPNLAMLDMQDSAILIRLIDQIEKFYGANS